MNTQAIPNRKVTMIPADPQMAEKDIRKKHLRVAPYCRVSTGKEEQLSSPDRILHRQDRCQSGVDNGAHIC